MHNICNIMMEGWRKRSVFRVLCSVFCFWMVWRVWRVRRVWKFEELKSLKSLKGLKVWRVWVLKSLQIENKPINKSTERSDVPSNQLTN